MSFQRIGIFAAMAAAACLTGCMSVHRTNAFNGTRAESNLQPIEAVEIENSGWFLFKCLPIASGDPAFPNMQACKFFTDTLTLDNNLRVLRSEKRITGGTYVNNVNSHRTEETIFFCLLSRKACHTSAVIMKSAIPQGKGTKK